jgi:hypothetical protein
VNVGKLRTGSGFRSAGTATNNSLAHATLGVIFQEIWSCIDYYAKFGEKRDGFLPEPDWSLKEVVCELKRAILLLYGHGCDDSSRAVKRTTNCTLVSLLKRVRGGPFCGEAAGGPVRFALDNWTTRA